MIKIKHSLIIVALFLVCLDNYSQKSYFFAGCMFLDIEYKGTVHIYDRPGGKIITTLKNDIDNENFVKFNIFQDNDSMFQVSAFYSLNEDSIITTGWIKKFDKLCTFSREYKDLILYKYPYSEKYKIIIPEKIAYSVDMWIVTDSQGEWVKVKATVDGKKYEGWLSPEMQCCNVYTTCS